MFSSNELLMVLYNLPTISGRRNTGRSATIMDEDEDDIQLVISSEEDENEGTNENDQPDVMEDGSEEEEESQLVLSDGEEGEEASSDEHQNVSKRSDAKDISVDVEVDDDEGEDMEEDETESPSNEKEIATSTSKSDPTKAEGNVFELVREKLHISTIPESLPCREEQSESHSPSYPSTTSRRTDRRSSHEKH